MQPPDGGRGSEGRGKYEPLKVDSLIQLGMARFDAAEIHVSPSKMSKLVRESIRKWGPAWTERIIDQYFKAAQDLQWESLERALKGRSYTVRRGR